MLAKLCVKYRNLVNLYPDIPKILTWKPPRNTMEVPLQMFPLRHFMCRRGWISFVPVILKPFRLKISIRFPIKKSEA